jgi:glutamyl-tRNA reductase
VAEPGFVVLGLSHRTATLAVRERASLDERQARRVLRRLVGDERLDEALVL